MVPFSNLLEGASRDDTYLYENLKGLMDILGYMDKDRLTQEGTRLLLALRALRLHLRLCFPETEPNKPLKMPVLEIYSRLTALLRYLLDADKLCIVTELPAKYNIWKATLAKTFNQLVEENECDVRLLDCTDDKDYTEYLTLADGRLNDGGDKETSGISYQVEDGIIKALCAYKELAPGKKKLGYLLRETGQKTQFVLALGGFEGKGIYLYASFYQPDRIRLLHRISCGLLFSPSSSEWCSTKRKTDFCRSLFRSVTTCPSSSGQRPTPIPEIRSWSFIISLRLPGLPRIGVPISQGRPRGAATATCYAWYPI